MVDNGFVDSKLMEEQSILVSKSNSSFYVPNLIEYVRLTLLFIMPFVAFNGPVFTALYVICGHLDAIDGFIARYLKQESNLGTMLDFSIDRISTVLLVSVLTILNPNIWYFFTAILMIDLFSHFCHLYSSVFLNYTNHKSFGSKQGPLLSLYYRNRFVLYYACLSYELWLGCFYLQHFYPDNFIVNTLYVVLFPGFIFKVMVHLLQIKNAMQMLSRT